MAELITMPKLSDTMEEGGISEWLKKEGEQVTAGEPLVSIETDKATIEYASPEDGTLLKILVAAGGAVAIQAPIAIIGTPGEDFSSLLTPRKKAAAAASPVPPKEKTTAAPATPQSIAPSGNGRIKASPLAKRVAAATGVALDQLQGSGPQGRIVLRDVKGASVRGKTSTAAARSDRRVPLTMMRKTIAKRLVQGKNEAPHFYLKVSAAMETLLQWRTQLNGAAGVKEGTLTKVSINDMLIYMVAQALRRHPEINASWQGDAILYHGQISIAIAVALPEGLLTPVLPSTDEKGLREIAGLSKSLVQKAIAGQLTPDDYQGGTFTISNLGMSRVEEFTAIINPPQAAILAVGAVRDEVVVDERGGFKAQKRVTLTLSCDHRVIDGAVGAKFLGTLVELLESPYLLLES